MARREGLTTLCYLERDDKYLMLHRVSKKNDISKDKWIGVGGHFEDDESPEECIKREIFEETGYDIPLEELEYRAVVTFISQKGDYELMSLFTAKAPDGEPKECDEGVLTWVDKDKIFDLNLWEGDKIFFRLMEKSHDFFSLKMVYDKEDNLIEAVLNGKRILEENKMVKDNNCGYCVGGEPLAKFGIKICDLEVSQLILFKEQSHPGRCIVAYKDHVSEIVDISDSERDAFFRDVNRASKAIHKAFNPDKVNYGAYGDTGCHLHMHLVPKYKDKFEWGGVFEMNPGKKFLTDAEYNEMIEKIKENLE